MKSNSSVIGLFPIPLGIYNINRLFYTEENSFKEQCFKTRRFIGTNSISNNTYILNSKEMIVIKTFIETSINQFLEESDPFPDHTSLYITQSWFTFTEKDQHHHIHNHPNSYISGVLYFDVDYPKDKIFFKNPRIRDMMIEKNNYTPFNSEEWSIPIRAGSLLLFPSYIEHFVKNYPGDKPRISLAFNTFVKGQLGSEHTLTKVKL